MVRKTSTSVGREKKKEKKEKERVETKTDLKVGLKVGVKADVKADVKKDFEELEADGKISPEAGQAIENGQPVINVGLVGHVDHGKTSLVAKLSGKWTDTHSEEIKRGITIRLGYADAIFYKCGKCGEYGTSKTCEKCKGAAVPLRKVSFIDAPGHESLMATMLSGAAIMDGAILLAAANEECPRPQTKEHLMALEIVGVKNIVIAQNKIDLVDEEQALKNYKDIKAFVKGTVAENAPVIPISAQHGINISALIEAIEKILATPVRNKRLNPIMFIARSFDVNKPGTVIERLVGGVLGGALKQGALKVGDTIEIRPGRSITKEGKTVWQSFCTKIFGIMTGGISVNNVEPGGSIGVMTKLDPSYVKADSLTGNVAGMEGKLPPVWNEITLKPVLLERVVGTKEGGKVEPIKRGENLMLNVNSSATVGTVFELRKDVVNIKLKIPVCCEKEDRFTISRLLGNRWRLIGYGKLV